MFTDTLDLKQFTDFSNNAKIRSELQYTVTLILAKGGYLENKYPIRTIPDVAIF